MKDRVRDMLVAGLGQGIVADTLGLDPSYISQLMSDTEFAAQVTAAKFERQQATSKRDDKYNELEDALIDKAKEAIEFVHKPRDIVAMLGVINKTVRRSVPTDQQVVINQQIVNISLPKSIQTKFTVSADNNIVQIGETDLVTISTDGFKDLLRKRSEVHEVHTIENGSS